MKVLVMANYLMGLISFRKEILQALTDKGYDVAVSAPYDEKYVPQLEECGCRFIETNVDRRGINPIKDLGLLMRYRKLIKAEKPDVVLTYTIKPNLYGGMACRMTKTVQFANITGLGTALENPGLLQKLIVGLYKVGLKKCKLAFFQNSANREFCQSHGMVKCDTILLNGSGVNLTHHVAQPYPKEEGVVKFIFISRIMKDIGVDELFEATRRLKAKYGDKVELHVVGFAEDNYTGVMERLAAEGTVIYHGTQKDVRPFVAGCHCLVLPSYHEGMSNVLQEASAAARPVVTCDVPGCKEIVERDKSGFLCEVKSADSLYEQMERFVQLPYSEKESMGIAARKKVERDFDRQNVVNKYLTEIGKLEKR